MFDADEWQDGTIEGKITLESCKPNSWRCLDKVILCKCVSLISVRLADKTLSSILFWMNNSKSSPRVIREVGMSALTLTFVVFKDSEAAINSQTFEFGVEGSEVGKRAARDLTTFTDVKTLQWGARWDHSIQSRIRYLLNSQYESKNWRENVTSHRASDKWRNWINFLSLTSANKHASVRSVPPKSMVVKIKAWLNDGITRTNGSTGMNRFDRLSDVSCDDPIHSRYPTNFPSEY